MAIIRLLTVCIWVCVCVCLIQEEVATAWKVIRTEPIILRLRFSLSQYLDGPGE